MRVLNGKNRLQKCILKIVNQFTLFVLCIALSSAVYAVAQGFYIGVATGPATNTGGTQPITVSQCPPGQVCGPCGPGCSNIPFTFSTTPGKPTTNQWGSRFFLGYMFNPYVGIEGGFNFFSGIHYKFTAPPGTQACSDARVRVRDIDVVGKFALPIQWFDVFVKAGVALTYQTISGSLNPPQTVVTNCNPCNVTTPGGNPSSPCACNTVQTSTLCGASTYRTKYDPIFTIGASYDLSQSAVVDISYTRLITGGPANGIDFIAVGISYHIVDVFCGQFLCD